MNRVGIVERNRSAQLAALLSALLLLAAAGCGQKGDLYLPSAVASGDPEAGVAVPAVDPVADRGEEDEEEADPR